MSVRDSTSTPMLRPPVFFRRTCSSPRRMSIFPCKMRRLYEISRSSSTYLSISFFSSSSERVARSGRGSISFCPPSGRLGLGGGAGKVQPQVEILILRACGSFLRLHDLFDQAAELCFQLFRLLARPSLGVDVDQRLVRGRQEPRPPPAPQKPG